MRALLKSAVFSTKQIGWFADRLKIATHEPSRHFQPLLAYPRWLIKVAARIVWIHLALIVTICDGS